MKKLMYSKRFVMQVGIGALAIVAIGCASSMPGTKQLQLQSSPLADSLTKQIQGYVQKLQVQHDLSAEEWTKLADAQSELAAEWERLGNNAAIDAYIAQNLTQLKAKLSPQQQQALDNYRQAGTRQMLQNAAMLYRSRSGSFQTFKKPEGGCFWWSIGFAIAAGIVPPPFDVPVGLAGAGIALMDHFGWC